MVYRALKHGLRFLPFALVWLALPLGACSGLGAAIYWPQAAQVPQDLPWVYAKLGNQPLRLMVARTMQEKHTGLMFRQELGANEGMLFVNPYPEYITFWMKNTLIPLDLIFFSPDLRVTEWIQGMTPGKGIPDADLPDYSSLGKAQYALEVASGSISKWGVTQGMRLEVPLQELESR